MNFGIFYEHQKSHVLGTPTRSTALIAKRWNRSSSPTASASITPGRSSTISLRNIPIPQRPRCFLRRARNGPSKSASATASY